MIWCRYMCTTRPLRIRQICQQGNECNPSRTWLPDDPNISPWDIWNNPRYSSLAVDLGTCRLGNRYTPSPISTRAVANSTYNLNFLRVVWSLLLGRSQWDKGACSHRRSSSPTDTRCTRYRSRRSTPTLLSQPNCCTLLSNRSDNTSHNLPCRTRCSVLR